MTREEAIQILSTRDAHGVLCGYTSGVTEALDMAIEALQADAVSRKDTVTLNSPISIQAEMVTVVRCKDCKHYNNDYMGKWCGRHQAPVWVKEEDFCSWGERKGGDDE